MGRMRNGASTLSEWTAGKTRSEISMSALPLSCDLACGRMGRQSPGVRIAVHRPGTHAARVVQSPPRSGRAVLRQLLAVRSGGLAKAHLRGSLGPQVAHALTPFEYPL